MAGERCHRGGPENNGLACPVFAARSFRGVDDRLHFPSLVGAHSPVDRAHANKFSSGAPARRQVACPRNRRRRQSGIRMNTTEVGLRACDPSVALFASPHGSSSVQFEFQQRTEPPSPQRPPPFPFDTNSRRKPAGGKQRNSPTKLE